jgi:hypothetical protein
MNNDRLSIAIEELESQLQSQVEEVVETKKMINSLLKRMGQPPRFADIAAEQVGTRKRDQYYGKPLATCIQEIIGLKKEALTPDEIIDQLSQGAFDFKVTGWREEDRARSLAISMSKNPVFHRLPNGTWGLLSMYPEVAARKAKEKRQATNGAQPAAQEQDPLE